MHRSARLLTRASVLFSYQKLPRLLPQTIRRKAGESGKLDKPIAAEDVADAVARQLQIEIVPQLVGMGGEVLSTTGDYQLPLKLLLPGGERAQLDVKVVST